MLLGFKVYFLSQRPFQQHISLPTEKLMNRTTAVLHSDGPVSGFWYCAGYGTLNGMELLLRASPPPQLSICCEVV